jgi:hypothetical protein
MHRYAVTLFLMLLSLPLLAQDADPAIPQGWDVGLTVYGLLGGVLTAVIAWALSKLNGLVTAKTKNELVKGALSRFIGSVGDAVAMVNQTLKAEIQKAKKPGSPGGAKITESEAALMKTAVLDALKDEYGGMAGISKFLGVLGLSGDATSKKVDTLIEAAVNGQKTAANPSTPA